MEEAEVQAVMSTRRQSSDTLGLHNDSYSTTTGQTAGLDLPPAAVNPYDMGMFQYHAPGIDTSYARMSHQASGSSSSSEQPQTRPHSMPTPHMNNIANWSWPNGDDGFGDLPTPHSAPVEQLPWSLLSSSNDISLWDASMPVNGSLAAHSSHPAPTALEYDSVLEIPLDACSMDPAQAFHQHPSGVPPLAQIPHPTPHMRTTTSPEELDLAHDLMDVGENHEPAHFSEKDISQSAREYL